MDYNDKRTWKLFAEGKTKGIFQLESNLGKAWAKKVAPTNIEELSALIAIIRPGCISSKTKITVAIKNHSIDGNRRFITDTIKNICKNKERYSHIISYDESSGLLIENKMDDIFYSGTKECFRVKISKGQAAGCSWYNLECTNEHPLLTNAGWKMLKDIRIGERIAVVKRIGGQKRKVSTAANRFVKNGPRTQTVDGYKYFSQICYKHYEEKCAICGWNKLRPDTHHIDGNRYTNNDPENLCFLCPNHHREAEANLITKQEIVEARKTYMLPKTKDIEWVTYIGKESVGYDMVYDISMQAPHHNFIAGNFIVHNCLKAYVDGKSMTQHYVDRKHGREEVTYLHPSLEEILKATYGVLVYQEQSMRIAQKIAGFNLQEADVLRKAIGKKKADLMNKVKKSFIQGAEKVGIVSKEDAEQIFGWIEKSARYAFNKSHSVSYAVCSYWSAYFKAHDTKNFFLSYLYYANEKQDPHQEIYELISEAKLFDIKVKTPSIINFYDKFSIKNNTIYFGIKDIKSLTGKNGDSLIEVLNILQSDLGKSVKQISWVEILLYLNPKISSTSFKAIASIGFFRGIKDNITRNKCLYDYEILRSLTKSEQAWLENNYKDKKWNSLVEALTDLAPTKKEGGGTSKVDRKHAILNEIQLLNNPPYELNDDPSWVIDQEVKFLGCPVSLSKVETSDTSAANTTCKDIINGKMGKNLCIVANIQRISDYKIKKGESKGKIMSFLTIEDETASLDSVIIFPNVKEKYKYVLYEGNNLIFCGSVNNNDSSFIVDQIHEI
jgi:hypothetical protein